MYDDSGAEVSEVVLKDRIHMSHEGMFVVVLTVARGNGRLLTSPDIISRGFIYLRDSEELMNLIRQYLKQKVARSFGGRKVDTDQLKKELKDEITHILYDQTRRTPIVIPVINEIGTGGGNGGGQQNGGGQANRNQQGGGRRQGQGPQQKRPLPPVNTASDAPAPTNAPVIAPDVAPSGEKFVQAPVIPEIKNLPFVHEEANKHIREI